MSTQRKAEIKIPRTFPRLGSLAQILGKTTDWMVVEAVNY